MMPSNLYLTEPSQQLLPWLPMRRENLTSRRYYSAIVQQNLIGEWEVFYLLDGIGIRLDNNKSISVTSIDDDEQKLLNLSNRRINRNYRQVTP